MSIFTPRSLRRVELQIHLTSPDHVAVRSDALEEDLFVLESDRHLLVAGRTPQTDAGCAFHSLGQEMGRTVTSRSGRSFGLWPRNSHSGTARLEEFLMAPKPTRAVLSDDLVDYNIEILPRRVV
jgi:hypothetical protein